MAFRTAYIQTKYEKQRGTHMFTFEKTTPEETGIPSRCILRFLNRLEAQEIPMHSIHILHKDRLAAEGVVTAAERRKAYTIIAKRHGLSLDSIFAENA